MWDDETETSEQPSTDWYFIGSGNINHDEHRINLHDGLFEEGILEDGGRVYWSYDRVVGTLILSNAELTNREDFNTVDSRSIYDNRVSGLPAEFFSDYGGDANRDSRQVPENAQVKRGERRHFLYQEGMATGETRSCYLLTDEGVTNRLQDPGQIEGNYDTIPDFF
ncbi:hypothetical protein [Haloarcula amylolytica]|uniref:hypothetical protein n=1 Tax=Haloarcula amylolytica TaxID=396317 RepID=UPI003C73D078